MVIKELLEYGTDLLRKNNIKTPQTDAAVLLCHVIVKDRLYLLTNANKTVEKHHIDKYNNFLRLRKSGMPVAYITGFKEFMSLNFKVTREVLIPRPDTETLCELIINRFREKELYFIDIGTGSGCIAISLLKNLPRARAVCIDISKEALEVARLNAVLHRVSDRVEFRQMDILSEVPIGEFDLLISNPPYIKTDVIPSLDIDVSHFEPFGALDGGSDGLVFYKRIIDIAPEILKESGYIALEIGYDQANSVMDVLGRDYCNKEVIRDLAGNNRVIFAAYKKNTK